MREGEKVNLVGKRLITEPGERPNSIKLTIRFAAQVDRLRFLQVIGVVGVLEKKRSN